MAHWFGVNARKASAIAFSRAWTVLAAPRPKLGRWAVELDGLLAANAAKPAREQLTLIRIFEELSKRLPSPAKLCEEEVMSLCRLESVNYMASGSLGLSWIAALR